MLIHEELARTNLGLPVNWPIRLINTGQSKERC